MCGRVNTYNKQSIYDIMKMFTDDAVDHFDARYNVSPGASLASMYQDGGVRAAAMHWGLIPLWAKPDTFKRPLINARAETIFEKPSFRTLVKGHRCVVPINGFYEWQRSEDGKRPHYFQASSADVLLLGGIYQFNKKGEAECCLVTTEANAVMSPVHHRMPVLIQQQEVEHWLRSDDRGSLEQMMLPADQDAMRCYEVSKYVNRASNDGAKCIEALAE